LNTTRAKCKQESKLGTRLASLRPPKIILNFAAVRSSSKLNLIAGGFATGDGDPSVFFSNVR
jgi:hypothetical protein